MLWALIGAGIGLAVGVVFQAPASALWEWGLWHLSHFTVTGEPSCKDAGWYQELDVDAFAYGQYSPAHTPLNTTDGDPRTAWAAPFTGNPDHDYIYWTMEKGSEDLALVCVRNGFTRDYDTYANNRRVKAATLSECGDPKLIALPDHVDLKAGVLDERHFKDWFEVRVNCSSDSVKMTVTETYPAGDHSHQMTLSDVVLYSDDIF